jgi:hypothetical protein
LRGQVDDPGLRVEGFRVEGLGVRVLGLRVQSVGFGFLQFRV